MCMLLAVSVTFAMLPGKTLSQSISTSYEISPAKNLGPNKKIMRRDPSDIIKVNDLYYLWYTRDRLVMGMTQLSGTLRLVMGIHGPKRAKYWLYYKGVQSYKTTAQTTRMGVAIAHKPEGP